LIIYLLLWWLCGRHSHPLTKIRLKWFNYSTQNSFLISMIRIVAACIRNASICYPIKELSFNWFNISPVRHSIYQCGQYPSVCICSILSPMIEADYRQWHSSACHLWLIYFIFVSISREVQVVCFMFKQL
jgi:hypothetical protein